MLKKFDSIEAVFFDLDGTLADSLPLIRHTYYTVFSEMNIPWGNDDVMRWIGRPLRDIAEYFAGKNLAEIFIDRYQRHYHFDHDRYTSLFPGTVEMLEKLKKRNIKTAIVTSKGRPGALRTVNYTGIANYIDAIVTANDVQKHKPLPEPVYKALELVGARAENAVFVGDSHFDLEAGKAAGAKVLGVGWGIASIEQLKQYEPEGILESWDELELYI